MNKFCVVTVLALIVASGAGEPEEVALTDAANASAADAETDAAPVPAVSAELFKSSSLNYLYSKAKKRQDAAMLEHIAAKFSELDKEFFAYAQEDQPDPQRYAQLESALKDYMSDRGLADVFDAIHTKNQKYSISEPLIIGAEEYKTLKQAQKAKVKAERNPFEARELNKIYQNALDTASFTPEELESLRATLTSYETKLTEHQAKMAEFAAQHSENTVDGKDHDATTEADLKAKNSELNAELQSVKEKVNSALATEFASERVSSLWKKVQSSQLPAAEKTRLRGDLESMQRKLDKLVWLQTQDAEGGAHPDDGKTPSHGKHGKAHDAVKAARKLKEQEAKIDKYEQLVLTKLAAVHTEL